MISRQFTRGLLRYNKTLKRDLKPINYAVCVDIECNCDSPVQLEVMEVIEISCLKVDISKSRADAQEYMTIAEKVENSPTFHRFVKPAIQPKLTTFCQELTGIMQETVDKAQPFDKMLGELMNWLKVEQLIDTRGDRMESFAFASCGNFDLNTVNSMYRGIQSNNNLELPVYFKEWINIKKTFVNHKKEWPKSLHHMLELIGEEPSGRLHSARDDCKNLAKVVSWLYRDGCEFYITNKL